MLWNPDTCWSPYQGAGVVMAASAGSANGSGIFSTTMRGLTPSGVVDSRSPHSTCSDVVVMNCGHSTSRSAQAFVSPGLGTRNFKRPFEPLFYGVENESRAWRRISPRIYFIFFLVVVFCAVQIRQKTMQTDQPVGWPDRRSPVGSWTRPRWSATASTVGPWTPKHLKNPVECASFRSRKWRRLRRV